jgi:hypothetical protein
MLVDHAKSQSIQCNLLGQTVNSLDRKQLNQIRKNQQKKKIETEIEKNNIPDRVKQNKKLNGFQ